MFDELIVIVLFTPASVNVNVPCGIVLADESVFEFNKLACVRSYVTTWPLAVELTEIFVLMSRAAASSVIVSDAEVPELVTDLEFVFSIFVILEEKDESFELS